MTYQQVLRYLNSLTNYEKSSRASYSKEIKLERIARFLEFIGNPQRSLKAIHVAGTKGKGSTSAFIAYILRQAGFRIGLYTSPHLHDFRERIRILKPAAALKEDFEGMITKKEMVFWVGKLKPLAEEYNRHSRFGRLTFFELYTALAFCYFKAQKTDFVVLETGMGGRLDATNAADSLVQVITPISYEHTQVLGNTLAKIAAEKAGIIKTKTKVITAGQPKEALVVIRKKAQAMGAQLVLADDLKEKGFKTRLIGGHQAVNAALAFKAVKALAGYGIKISAKIARMGIKNTRWPGRCEVIKKSPLIVLDGAQNLASAQALKKAIQDNFKYKQLILVLGICQDKDIAGICSVLKGLAVKIILTCAATPRAASPKKLAAYFSQRVYLTNNVKEAKILAISLAGKEDLILVTGSLFVVGEFRSV